MKIVLGLIAVLLWGITDKSEALISAYGQIGARSASISDGGGDVDGQVIKVGAHLDPLPLPISAGIGLTSSTTNSNDTTPSGTGLDIGLEVKAWIPFVPVVTPYVQLSYIVSGAHVYDGNIGSAPIKQTYKVTGLTYAAGIQYPLIPLLGLNFEVVFGELDYTSDKLTVNGTESDGTDATLDIMDIMLGAHLSI